MRTDIDIEISGMMGILAAMSQLERPEMERQIRDAIDAIRAGVHQYPILDAALICLDPDLRTRVKNGELIIERYHGYLGAWAYVCDWPKHPEGLSMSASECVAFLRAHDMQRFGPIEWLRRKREAAAKVRERNEKIGDDKVAAAIDLVQNPDQFVAVEQAVATGERIIAHGDDLKRFERLYKAGQNTPADDPRQCINPGISKRLGRK